MKMTRKRVAGCAMVLAAVGMLSACELGEPTTRIDVGHVDVFAVAVEDDGQFFVHVHDEATDEELLPGDVLLQALPESKTQVPADANFAFLGAPGADTWILPQVQDPELLWPGVGTEEIEPGVLVGDELTWSFDAIAGPGDLAVFTTDPFGVPDVLLNSADGLSDSVAVPAGAHQHANWAFSAPGRYVLEFRATGIRAADNVPIDSGPVYYHFVVDDYECADVDGTTAAPNPVLGGSSVTLAYDLSNCGSIDATFDVSAIIDAPPACGGGCFTVALRTESQSPGDSAAFSDTITAPACAGVHQVTVTVTSGASTDSFGSRTDLTVS